MVDLVNFLKNKNVCQQLGFRCVRSTNNETRVERNRLQILQYYEVTEKFLKK